MLDLKESFRLGTWTVLPARLMIKGEGGEKHLEPKAMEMLVYLAEHAGETVSRETLGKEIWRGTYGSDEALSRIISLLRSQLGDSSKNPRYIETIPKVGYRLITHPEPTDGAGPLSVRSAVRSPMVTGVVIAASLVLLIAGYLILGGNQPATGGPESYTVAVLPFEDIGGTDSDSFLSVGLTNEIISSLNRSPLLRIVTRNSLENVQDGATSTTIDYFLGGRVGVTGDVVRVFAEITDAREGIIVWSDSFESPGTDYLEVQQELSDLLFTAINQELDIAVESPQMEDFDIEAYSAYLNGIFLSKLRGEEPLRAAIAAFTNALSIEPDFDSARVALAHAQVLLPYYSLRSESDAFAAAASQLDALTDQSNAEAEAILGFIAFREWRWLDAEQHFINSLALNDDIANTHVWYSQFLTAVGRLDESLSHAQTAYDLDSVSPVVNGRLATALLWDDQDDAARRLFAAAENLGFSSFQNRGILVLLMRFRDYGAIRQGLRELHPGIDLEPLLANLEYLDNPDARQSLVDIMDQLISAGQLIPHLEFGVWVIFEQWDRALATLQKYSQNKKYLDIEVLFTRESQRFREDPIFEEVTELLGLDEFWQQSGQPDFRLQ